MYLRLVITVTNREPDYFVFCFRPLTSISDSWTPSSMGSINPAGSYHMGIQFSDEKSVITASFLSIVFFEFAGACTLFDDTLESVDVVDA